MMVDEPCTTGTAAGLLCLLLLPAVGWCVSSVMSSVLYSGVARLQGFPSCSDKLKVVAEVCPHSPVQSQLKEGFGDPPPLAPSSEYSVQYTVLNV